MTKIKKYEEMMILPAAERFEYFRKAYSLELGKRHAQAALTHVPFQWPIERLDEMVEKVMTALRKRNVSSGPAFEAVLKFFQIKTQKELWVFLGVNRG